MADDQQKQTQTSDDLAQAALQQASATDSAKVGESLISLQNVIERNAFQLDKVLEDLRIQRESLKNILENDTALSEAQEKAKTATLEVKERKTRLQNSPEVTQLKAAITDLSEQKKEIEEALNNHLLNLYKMTGAAIFNTSSGEEREFSVRASLKRKKQDKSDA